MTSNNGSEKNNSDHYTFRLPTSKKKALKAKYGKDTAEQLRNLVDILVSNGYSGDDKIESTKKEIKDLERDIRREREKLKDQVDKVDSLQTSLELKKQELEELQKNQDKEEESKKEKFRDSYEQLIDKGFVKFNTYRFQTQGVNGSDKNIEDSVWAETLNEIHLEEQGEELNEVPIKKRTNQPGKDFKDVKTISLGSSEVN